MKEKINVITKQKWFSTLIWIVLLIIAWEIGATVVAATKRSPQNILPHLYEIISAAFSTKPVSGGMSATMVVLTSAGATLFRALLGFIPGMIIGFLLALIMKISNLVEKTLFPYLMIIQLIPVLGLAPIILAITGDINAARVIIAAILSFYPVATNTLAGFKSVEKEKYELLSKEYINSSSPLTIKCPEGHITDSMTLTNFNEGHRCLKCYNIKTSKRQTISFLERKELVERYRQNHHVDQPAFFFG